MGYFKFKLVATKQLNSLKSWVEVAGHPDVEAFLTTATQFTDVSKAHHTEDSKARLVASFRATNRVAVIRHRLMLGIRWPVRFAEFPVNAAGNVPGRHVPPLPRESVTGSLHVQ